ncbi:hypothetical protein ACIBI3_11640 [Actinomadura luteofluorescens]|uniref:hypothetical protein n=1 Tax=Actinomadura luteofluorescens TaxID=46163 RepID=UPI00346CEBD6
MKKLRLKSKNTRRVISIAVGAVLGAVLGGLIEGLDYAAFLADLHHHGIDPFEYGDLGYLVAKVVFGAVLGAAGGLGGAVCGVFGGFGGAQAREVVVRIAGGTAILAVTACATYVVMAAFGAAVGAITGPLGTTTLAGLLLLGGCGFAAGIVAGGVGTRN